MQIKRREFLGSAVAGTAGALVSGNPAEAAPATTESADPVALVPLGKHLKSPRLGLGFGMKGWERQSNLTRRGREHTENVIRHAYALGLRFFDNADIYGSHQYVARALKGKPRESYVLASKVWLHPGGIPDEDRADADVAVKRFLKELQTDYIDLVQIHCMSKRDWPQQMRKQMDLLAELKQQGLIRAHGISCHGIPALEAAVEEPWVDVVHARINPFGIKMDGPTQKVLPVLKKVHAAGKGVVAIKVIGEGTLSKDPRKREQSVRFVTELDCVDVMIVGFEQTQEIDEFKTQVGRILAAG